MNRPTEIRTASFCRSNVDVKQQEHRNTTCGALLLHWISVLSLVHWLMESSEEGRVGITTFLAKKRMD